jgi:hypothetical protein
LAESCLLQNVLEDGLSVAWRNVAAAVPVSPVLRVAGDDDFLAHARARLVHAELWLLKDSLEDGLGVARRDVATAVCVAPDQ